MALLAQTRNGPVQGREKDGALLFAAIPYAAPPVGERRFLPPAPHPDWTEPRDARRFGPAAPQIASGGMTDPPVRWAEDCLTLNVQTPALDAGARPVLVWIHGGGYRNGQGAVPWYNGARFAAGGGIVVVSINYRLGALGFTDLRRFGTMFEASGSHGTLDQIAALGWVRDNIAHFGGDPAKVTIAGESAGAFSVATLLGSPRAAGLFRAAIAQSGAAHHVLAEDKGQLVAETFLGALGAKDIASLQAASVDAVLAAQAATIEALERGPGRPSALGDVSAFYPVAGSSALPQQPLAAIKSGLNRAVPLLAGTNRDETTLWQGAGETTDQQLAERTEALGGEALLRCYRASRPAASNRELLVAITTAHMFRVPAIRLAEARPGNTYLYEFNWRSRVPGLGATHALEIPFAFDNLHQPGVAAFIGDGPKPQHVADAMHEVWTRFVQEGDPGFPPYDIEQRKTMVFDDETRLAQDPDALEREAWEGWR